MRRCARALQRNAISSAAPTPSLETLPLHLYNTVIQQLKQQKHELQVQTQSEQHRARTSENFSQTVLSNLSCGVLVFGSNGLVKTANPAAKAILGFASTTGMSAEDIFRGAVVVRAREKPVSPDETPIEPVAHRRRGADGIARRAASGARSKPTMRRPRAKSDSSRSLFLRYRPSTADCSASLA